VALSADTFSIGEVSTMVGLSAHTIRAWERRYAAVRPSRSGSRQRRYRLDEVETLKRIKDLASARGLSLRLAVAEANGEAPEIGAAPDVVTDELEEFEVEETSPWRGVADLDPRLLVLLDQRGRVFDCNVAFARLAGKLRFEMQGQRFSKLVEAYDRAKAVTLHRGTPQRRTGWELNMHTPVVAGLYSFESTPLRHRGTWLIALSGQAVG
jgi:PAS domain-containing protein